MGRVPSSVELALIKSFWSTMQLELLGRSTWTSRAELSWAMFEWIEGFYSPTCRHTACDNVSLVELERLHTTAATAGRINTAKPSRKAGRAHDAAGVEPSRALNHGVAFACRRRLTMRATTLKRSSRSQQSLYIAGVVLIVAGIASAIVLTVVANVESPRTLTTLPVTAYSGYEFRDTTTVPIALQNRLLLAFLGTAAVGVVLLATAVLLRFQHALAAWLIVPGALLAATGFFGGLVAKGAADGAAVAASGATRLVISSNVANGPALTFDPTSARHVAPDYTMFWAGTIVGMFGVVALVTGIVIAASRLSATRTRVASS